MKRQLIITKCQDCWDWFPADSWGCGTFCGNVDRVVDTVKPDAEIPEWCPRLPKDKNNDNTTNIKN